MTIASRIHFEEPPAIKRAKKTKNEKIAAALQRHPGEWARISVYTSQRSANSIAHQIRTGKLAVYTPAGAFEAVSRTVEKEHRVYARYIGADGEHR